MVMACVVVRIVSSRMVLPCMSVRVTVSGVVVDEGTVMVKKPVEGFGEISSLLICFG